MSLTRLVRPKVQRKPLSKFTPRHLALSFALLFAVIAGALFYPIKMVFSGQEGWILNQNLAIIKLDYVKTFFGSFPVNDILIRNYSVLMLIGVLSGFFVAIYFARRNYIATTLIDRLAVGLIIFGLIGARIFFVLFNLDKYESNEWDMLFLYKGGLSIIGALAGATAYLWSYCRKYQFNFFEIADILVPAVLVGQIIGRFGNFFNYEAYGQPTTVFWKMYVPDAAIYANAYRYPETLAKYFHPTFLYEIILNIILLLVVLWFYEKWTEKKSGLIFAAYLMGYGLIRTFTELFRLDALKIDLNLGLKFPNFVIKIIESIFANRNKDYVIGWFEDFRYDDILVSQIVAIFFFVVGVYLWKRRSKVTFFKKNLREINFN